MDCWFGLPKPPNVSGSQSGPSPIHPPETGLAVLSLVVAVSRRLVSQMDESVDLVVDAQRRSVKTLGRLVFPGLPTESLDANLAK